MIQCRRQSAATRRYLVPALLRQPSPQSNRAAQIQQAQNHEDEMPVDVGRGPAGDEAAGKATEYCTANVGSHCPTSLRRLPFLVNVRNYDGHNSWCEHSL